MLRSQGTRLLAITRLRLAPLVERVLRKAMPARVQRMGTQALGRVVERFPAIGELLQVARTRVERALEIQQRQQPGATNGQPAAPVYAPPSPIPEQPEAAPITAPGPSYETILFSLRDPDWKVRADAANLLGTWRQDGVEDALHSALRDDSAEVAATAAVSLSRLGTARAISALREVLENRDGYFSPVTRAACVHGLARCIDSDEAQAVLDVVQDVDAEVSIAAILAISERLPELATPRLLSVLSDDTSYFLPLVRLAAANALSRLGTLSNDARAISCTRRPTATCDACSNRRTKPIGTACPQALLANPAPCSRIGAAAGACQCETGSLHSRPANNAARSTFLARTSTLRSSHLRSSERIWVLSVFSAIPSLRRTRLRGSLPRQ